MTRVIAEATADEGAPASDAAADPPAADALRARLARLPWPRLLAMLGVVVVAVTLLEVTYASAPIPPGVDPGDWITRSGAYVGLSVPPVASFGSPYIYPPLLFPLLGGLLRFFGNPLSTGFVAGGLLFLFFGFSLIYVASKFLRFGPLQLGFVGACMFSGTLLYMLLWGAYPNFFAFIFLNLTFVYLLMFARTGERLPGLLLGISLALLYLTHSLTFAIGIVTVGVTAVLLLLVVGPRFLWARMKNRGLIVGALVLVLTVVTYSLVLRAEGISPPNYLGANPVALTLDNIGQLFVPMATGPMFFPAGDPVYLSPALMIGLLTGTAAILVVVHSAVFRYRPGWVTLRHTVAISTVVAALITPVAGTLAGVGTDYPRFVYFLPVPIALLTAVTLDSAIRRPVPPATARESEPFETRQSAWGTPSRAQVTAGYLAVGVVLVLLFANVAAPTASQDELIETGTSHSAQFLQAAQWLAANPTTGSVLTLQSAARWTESLTDRGVYDEGPTWLDFETWQIVNSQSAFWALNSRYAVTNGGAIESYTPNSTSVLSQSPMYSVFDQGVIFPIVRVLPGALNITVDTPNGTLAVGPSQWGLPTLVVNASTGVGTITYSTEWFQATFTGTIGAGGSASIEVHLAANAGNTLSQFSLPLGSPPAGVALMHPAVAQSVAPSSTGFSWLTTGTLGALPSPVTVNTSGVFTPAPTTSAVSNFPANVTLSNTFVIPAGSTSYQVDLQLDTPGAGNPGVALPLVLDTESFLTTHDIHFLLITSGSAYAPTIDFFQSAFGFTTVYLNSQWEVLEG
jgi:hypothetical protein